MRILQARGITFFSQKSTDVIKLVCQYMTVSAISIAAIIAAGKWAVLALTGIILFGMILKAGE